jgi:hypothetical protein
MAEQNLAPTAIEIVAGTPGVLRALLASVPPSTLQEPVDDGWSPKDVVAHLLDVEQVAFTDRMRRILNEDRPRILPIDPSARLDQLDYRSWPPDRLLDELKRRRGENVAMLRGLSSEQFARVGDHAEAGEVSVSDLAHYCAVHDMMHLAQIAKMLQAQLADRVGNMRRYLE